jgi:hypothetical protein
MFLLAKSFDSQLLLYFEINTAQKFECKQEFQLNFYYKKTKNNF